jgi:hypothetical protein
MTRILLFLLALTAFGQTPAHYVTLTWQDPTNPAGTTYNVYRGEGPCNLSPALTRIASGISALTYEDDTVVLFSGTYAYCYAVTAVNSGQESVKSNTASGLFINVASIVGPAKARSKTQKK